MAKSSSLPEPRGLLRIPFLEAQKQQRGLGKLLRENKQGTQVAVIVHFCRAFPGTFQLDLRPDSSPWALYVTKGKTDSQKGFLSQASGFCLEASKNLGF